MKQLLLSIGLVLLAALLSACGGLAGEPEIVGQMPSAAPQETNLVPPAIEPSLILGAQVYAENCVRCHGATGAGDGEFVLSGQITGIPIFADPAQHLGRTATEYYTTVTQGRLEKLMPPFADSLSDEQRWAVANYVFTLAGASAPLPESTESSVASVVVPESTASSPEATAEVTSEAIGTISGHVVQGTAGGLIPVGSPVNLQVVDLLGVETSFSATLNADASYQFANIPIADSSAYRVSIDYAGGTYSSEFAVGTPLSPNMVLDTTIYETTDDVSVLQINVVLTQIDLIGENTLQVWQMINVTNISDRLYIYPNANGRSVSVRVPVPEGFSLSPANDLDRFAYDGAGGYIYDTRPVVPFSEHSFHIIYTVPFTGSLTVNQLFDYEFFGPYEAYVDASVLRLSGNAWQDLGTQTVNDVNYSGIGMVDGSATGKNLSYSVNRTGLPINRSQIGYGLMLLGLVFILGASFLYWRGRKAVAVISENPVSDASTESLMKAIAELDERFETRQISKKAYEKQRQALKAQLLALMKEAK